MAVSTSKTKKKSAAAKSVKKSKTAPAKKMAAKSKSLKTGTAKAKNGVSKISAKKTGTKITGAGIKAADSNNKASEKKPAKTYLNDKELSFFRDLIVEQKNEILENARRLRESLIDENTGDYVGDNSTFSMHMAEQGSDEMEREKAYMFIQRDEKHLFYLENALERIAKKTYGLCISCGRSILKARLEAVPITSHCINCKQSLSS
jgi:RNA polymerase-binding protein DksA